MANRFPADYLDAIRLVLEGAADNDIAADTIEKILEKAPKTQAKGTESVAIFVEAIRELGYSYKVNQQ